MATVQPEWTPATSEQDKPPQLWPAIRAQGPRRHWDPSSGPDLIAALSDILPVDLVSFIEPVRKLDPCLLDVVEAMAQARLQARAPSRFAEHLPNGRALIRAWL